MKVMIFAAGRGERMGSLTQETPKPMLPLLNKPLLQHNLERLIQAGYKEFVINTAYLPHIIVDHFGDGSHLGCQINYSHEEQALETAGGIINALDLLDDSQPFIAINSDILTDYPLQHLRSVKTKSAHLILVDNPQHHPQGDFNFITQKDAADTLEFGESYTFSGIGIYHPRLFQNLPIKPLKLRSLFKQLIEQRQLTGEYYPGYWIDVGTEQRLQAAEQWLNSQFYNKSSSIHSKDNP